MKSSVNMCCFQYPIDSFTKKVLMLYLYIFQLLGGLERLTEPDNEMPTIAHCPGGRCHLFSLQWMNSHILNCTLSLATGQPIRTRCVAVSCQILLHTHFLLPVFDNKMLSLTLSMRY